MQRLITAANLNRSFALTRVDMPVERHFENAGGQSMIISNQKPLEAMDSVLIIEDSRAMQKAIQRIFVAESFEVKAASDGISGLNLFREKQPSAVILDLKLPGMSGRDL